MENTETTIEKTSMQIALELLNEFALTNDISDFYCISFRAAAVDLQGKYSSDKVRKYIAQGFSNEIDSQGYVKMAKDNFLITLTE